MVAYRSKASTTSETSPTDSAPYSPPSVENCKPYKRTSRAEYHKRRQRQVYLKLLKGMRGESCLFFTLVNGRDLSCDLRKVAWHRISAHLHVRWPGFQSCTVFEYAQKRGVHLHVVVKGTSGLTEEWVKHVLSLLKNGTEVGGWREVYDVDGLAAYLTKQLGDPVQMDSWPRKFRPVSFSQRWYTGWQSRTQRSARHVA